MRIPADPHQTSVCSTFSLRFPRSPYIYPTVYSAFTLCLLRYTVFTLCVAVICSASTFCSLCVYPVYYVTTMPLLCAHYRFAVLAPGLLCLYPLFTLRSLFVNSPITRNYSPFTRLYSVCTLSLPCVYSAFTPGLLRLYYLFTLRLLFVLPPITRAYPSFTLVSTLSLLPFYPVLTLRLPLVYSSTVLRIFPQICVNLQTLRYI